MYAHPYAPFNYYLTPKYAGLLAPRTPETPLAEGKKRPSKAQRQAQPTPTCFKNIRTYRRYQGDLLASETAPSEDPLFFVAGVVAPRESPEFRKTDHGD